MEERLQKILAQAGYGSRRACEELIKAGRVSVNSDGVMKSLLGKGLIQEFGRAEGPGRPILYGTTPDFLQHFGLSSLSELPPLNLSVSQNGNNGSPGYHNHNDALKG